ncbi:CinA family protein [Kitasatospora terrestris]|uniref:CinA family protein n=1 Tax=Kitasatospora terrestris TaxID=258051 RepID=A0ABP9EQQ3_9ACTN
MSYRTGPAGRTDGPPHGPERAEVLTRQIAAALAAAGHTVAVAESLTAGRLAAAMADAPGAGETFLGGVVAYATEVKEAVLGVDAELLAATGAVHPDVAVQMAQGVRDVLGATYGLATTGVAGPAGQDGRAPGTVYVAVAGPRGSRAAAPALRGAEPDAVRTGALLAALQLLHDALRP